MVSIGLFMFSKLTRRSRWTDSRWLWWYKSRRPLDSVLFSFSWIWRESLTMWSENVPVHWDLSGVVQSNNCHIFVNARHDPCRFEHQRWMWIRGGMAQRRKTINQGLCAMPCITSAWRSSPIGKRMSAIHGTSWFSQVPRSFSLIVNSSSKTSMRPQASGDTSRW